MIEITQMHLSRTIQTTQSIVNIHYFSFFQSKCYAVSSHYLTRLIFISDMIHGSTD
jgi:hypothetical protein